MILTQWQQYLTDNGAEFTDKKLVSFGNLEDELHIIKTTSVISDLSNTSEIIRVSGTDSANFLQNILKGSL